MSDITTEYAADFLAAAGFLVPFPDCRDGSALWEAESSYSEAGPRPGGVVPQQATDLRLFASGDMAANARLEVLVLQPGHPRREAGVGVAFRPSDTGDYYGFDPPAGLTSWQALVWSDTADETKHPHIITLADETALLVYQRKTGGLRKLYTRRKTVTGAWGSEVEVTSVDPTVTGQDFHPCLIELRNGDVLLAHWVEGGGYAQVQTRRSTDGGVSWALESRYALDAPLDTSVWTTRRRLRGAAGGGQVLLVAHVYDSGDSVDRVLQYGSTDNGASFSQVGDPTGAAYVGYQPEVVYVDDLFVVLFIETGLDLIAKRVGSAFTPFWTATTYYLEPGDGSGALINFYLSGEGECAACVGDDGAIYVLSTMFQIYAGPVLLDVGYAAGTCLIHRSRDGGLTWEGMGKASTDLFSVDTRFTGGAWWSWRTDQNSGNDVRPKNFAATFQAGRVLVAHNWKAATANEDDSLAVATLGGSSTLTMPSLVGFDRDSRRVNWTVCWLPYELPDNAGWSRTFTGSPTVDLVSPGVLNVVLSSETNVYSYNPQDNLGADIGTPTQGCILRAVLEVVNGGSTSSSAIALRIRLADGTDDVDLQLYFSTTGFALWDNHGAQIGSTVTFDTTDIAGGVEVMFAAKKFGVAVWYRRPDPDNPYRAWTAGPSAVTSGNNTSSPAPNIQIDFGALTASTNEVNWREVCFVVADTGDHLAGGFSNPDDLFGRTLSGDAVYLYGDTRVRGVDGPGHAGDEFFITPVFDYAVERVFPGRHGSPRLGWRSIGVGAQTIAIHHSASLLKTAASRTGTDLLGLALLGINWRTATLYGVPVSGPDVALATIDTSEGLNGLSFTRVGNRVGPAAGSSSAPFLALDEFADSYFEVAAAGPHRIAEHPGGHWTNLEAQQPWILLDDISGSEPTTGTGRIWPRNVVLLVNLAGQTFTGFKLVIDGQSTAEGYLELGTLLVGDVTVTAPLPSHTWSRITEGGSVQSETPDRVVRSRLQAPARKTWEVTWFEAMWTGPGRDPAAYGGDYLKAYTGSGGEPVATMGAAAQDIEGMQARVQGAHVPLMYLHRIPIGSDTAVLLNRPADFLYGRMAGPVRVEHVHGLPGAKADLMRVARIPIREEV